MADEVSGLESGASNRGLSELVAGVNGRVQDVLKENSELRKRWDDPAAVRARWEELKDKAQVAACVAFFGLHWLDGIRDLTAAVSPWW
jgi:hypothetical protein